MALTPEDRAFYEEKLGWKGFLILFVATVATGAIIFPVLLYIQDSSHGLGGQWNSKLVTNVSISGMLLGAALSVILFFLARFYLWLGWLPRRR